MNVNDSIRVEELCECFLCGNRGRPLYRGLRDPVYSVPGLWDFSYCSSCHLAWLNPRPIRTDAGKAYPNYFTHEMDPPQPRLQSLRKRLKNAVLSVGLGYDEVPIHLWWRWVGRFVNLSPALRELVGVTILYLPRSERGRLVDVGCGNGTFLATMRDLGWDVLGVEIDPEGARVARDRYGLPVFAGNLEEAGLPDESVDVVTMSHVIEHVHEPIKLLRECERVLKPTGKLIVLTPNVESLGHRLFKEFWRGLEPSRHLFLFSPRSLLLTAQKAGFNAPIVTTSACTARYMYAASRQIRKRAVADFQPPLSAGSLAFGLAENLFNVCSRKSGEEIALLAVKRES